VYGVWAVSVHALHWVNLLDETHKLQTLPRLDY
jgi:hypothetical protein